MTALTQERDTQRRNGEQVAFPVAAATKIFAGSLVCISTVSNFATKGATATTLKAVGMAHCTVDNTAGANGAVSVTVERKGWFPFANSAAGDLIVLGDVGSDCFLVDDQTVAKTSGTNTRSVAGKVRDVTSTDVWIEFN
ncbi:MAG: hypothetical protein ACKVOT_14125 [Polaromonas sp.]